MKLIKTIPLAAGLYLFLVMFAPQNAGAAMSFTVTPSTISNTYQGPITLQVIGLTNTETVVVQKFLDANTNGVVDAGDALVQQFNLTDGVNFVIGGVTNLNVPGDTDGTTNGQITAILNFPNGDFAQNFVGNYLFVLSSPVGHFTATTRAFTITNFPYVQKFTGSVVSGGGNVPNAVVLLFPPPRPGKNGPGGTPLAGTVANNSGSYTIQVPPGTYVPMAFKSNYVANYATSPVLTLSGSQTLTTNLALASATATISGKAVDAANNSIGLPGVIMPASDNSGHIAVGFTDTNGNFTIGVTSGTWGVGSDNGGFTVHGYVGFNDNLTNASAGTTGITLAYPKATALFYGSVKDTVGNRLPGIDISAYDNNNTYSVDAYSNTNGNYIVGVLGGLGNSDPWQLQVGRDSSPTTYIFSQSLFNQNGGTNISSGSVAHQNFTAMLATNHVTGNVQHGGTNLVHLGVSAYASIGGLNFQTQADTDDNGNYSLNVANTNTWSVAVNCQGGNDSLDGILGAGNYQCPNNQNVPINNNNGTANFTVQPPSSGYYIYGLVADNSFNPITNVNVYADDGSGHIFSAATDGTGYYQISVGNGNWNVYVDCGELNSLGYQCVSNQQANVSGGNVQVSFTAQPINSPLQVTTAFLPDGTNTAYYSQTFQASGGTQPYSWSVPDYSAAPPANLTLATNGVLSGTLATSGTFYFYVRVTDATMTTADSSLLALNIVNPPLAPLLITNVSLPGGMVGLAYSAQLGATGGQPPYGNWQLAAGSASLPAGLSLDPTSGLISGTPATNKVFGFKVQVTDANSTTTNKILSITINPRPTISAPVYVSGGRFQMAVTAAAGMNFTVQMSTNLSSTNWSSLLITNPSSGSFLFNDGGATNPSRYYRILLGP